MRNQFIHSLYGVKKTFYVRPSGTTYGTGDGTSYANAWSGFSNINWSLVENNTLIISGTHLETITIGAGNCTIWGDSVNVAAVIDGENTRVRGWFLNGHNNVTVGGSLSFVNHTTEGIYNGTTTGTSYTGVTFGASGNQTVQNEAATCEVIYNLCTFENGVDDGVSLHLNANVTLNNCTIRNNSQGVNAISTATLVANNCVFSGNTTDIQPDSDSDFTINNCLITSNVACNSSVDAKFNNCLFTDGDFTITSFGGCLVEECRFENTSKVVSTQGDASRVNINRSYFEVAVTSKIGTNINGSYTVRYCSFYINTGTNIYAFQKGTQVTRSTVENCTIVGNANTGRGATGFGIDFVNCIFNDLNLGFNPNGAGSITVDHCNIFDVTTKNINQNGGTFTETNAVIGDPLLADVPNLDFSLGVGSSCIGTGATLTDAVGVDTADWGNGTSTFPNVTTKNQGVSWDVGAYIS